MAVLICGVGLLPPTLVAFDLDLKLVEVTQPPVSPVKYSCGSMAASGRTM